jgi:hypothetical protein
MMVVVQRPMPNSPEGPLMSGQLVDATGWKWLDKLVDQKYVRPATDADIRSAEEVETTRRSRPSGSRPRVRKATRK